MWFNDDYDVNYMHDEDESSGLDDDEDSNGKNCSYMIARKLMIFYPYCRLLSS
jgi:hypothetical protein